MGLNDFNCNYLNKLLENISTEQKSVFLLEDFNVNLSNYNEYSHTNKFLDSLASYSFIPSILQPTRITSHSNTLIDNIFSNVIDQDIISGNLSATISDPLPQFSIIPNMFGNITGDKSNIYERDWSKFDRENFILDYFSVGWEDLLKTDELNADNSTRIYLEKILTGTVRGTSKEKLYQEVGLESLQLRRWYRKLCLFYKIFKNKSPAYLFNLIPARNTHYSRRTSDNTPCFNTKHSFFKNSFFPSTIIEWNKLDLTLRKCDSFNVFKKEILKFIHPSSNSFYNCHNPIGIKYITRIRLGLSHLREHKFKHSFQDSINPICNCGNDVESAIHFFLHSPLYSNECCTLLNSLSKIDYKLLDSTDTSLTQILLFGNSSFTTNDNTKIINLTIDFVL